MNYFRRANTLKQSTYLDATEVWASTATRVRDLRSRLYAAEEALLDTKYALDKDTLRREPEHIIRHRMEQYEQAGIERRKLEEEHASLKAQVSQLAQESFPELAVLFDAMLPTLYSRGLLSMMSSPLTRLPRTLTESGLMLTDTIADYTVRTRVGQRTIAVTFC